MIAVEVVLPGRNWLVQQPLPNESSSTMASEASEISNKSESDSVEHEEYVEE